MGGTQEAMTQQELCLTAAKLLGQPWLIQDVTTCIRQPTLRNDLAITSHIVLHRIEVGRDALEIAEWFRANPQWCGADMPYKFVVCPDGVVQQAVLMQRRTMHARGLNHRSIGIGIIGDFRSPTDLGGEEATPLTGIQPTPAQVAATIALCCRIQDGFQSALEIVSHTAVSEEKDKICPGPLFPYTFVAQSARAFGQLQWRQLRL